MFGDVVTKNLVAELIKAIDAVEIMSEGFERNLLDESHKKGESPFEIPYQHAIFHIS